MADEKNSTRAYERGYHDGREGKSYDTPSALGVIVGAVMPGVDPVSDQKDYSKGYYDGKEDKKR